MDWVRLHGPLARPFMRAMGTTEARPWGRADRPGQARTLMAKLRTLARTFPEHADMQAISMLHELAIACGHQGTPPKTRRTPAHEIRDAMARQVASGMNVEQFARAFKLSRSTLYLKFREAFGKSPVQVLTELRIEHAKELLINTDMPISEVACASGYDDPLYFSRQFRKRTGMAPRVFRTMVDAPDYTASGQ